MVRNNPFHKIELRPFIILRTGVIFLLIRKHGLYSTAKLKLKGMKIPAPGGNEWSQEADANKGVDRYVHLCFKANHPMEYLAREDGRIMDSIFLQIHPDVLQIKGVMFSAGVSNKAGVEIVALEKAYELIDFEARGHGRTGRTPR